MEAGVNVHGRGFQGDGEDDDRVTEEVVATRHQVIHLPRMPCGKERVAMSNGFAQLVGHRAFVKGAGAIDCCHVCIKPPAALSGTLRHAFGMMKMRFRVIFLQALEVHHTFVPHVITARAVLHSICISAGDIVAPDEGPEDDAQDDGENGVEVVSGAHWRDQLSAEVSALEEVPPDHDYCHQAIQTTITAESGHNVTLTCRSPNNNIRAAEWNRADLGDEYVFLYRDGHVHSDDQHPSFKNRVDLHDREMKDGDASLILKNVTINDNGTYECRVVQEVGGPMTLINSTDLVVVPPVQTTITAESGHNVTLTCRSPNNNIRAAEWNRADLGDEYVFLYRDGHVHSDDQHPSFKNRVDLHDREMKDGDASLILKNVTINDNGTYECRVVQEVGGPMTLINSTDLVVVPPGE
ncbi:V-set and immunoglobulin domain-containing protein 8-like [Maylandia zebra]|uniref:V-set and immunoglobulin domain-containing protein 8-like n=1 Tax=Maylandia zebra TaxID=106582 RepID=UPI00403C9826